MAKHYLQLSKILKKLLADRKMRPVDLARAVNMPTPTIHRLVTGKSTCPYRSSLEPIAQYFSVEVDDLLGEKVSSSKSPSAIMEIPLMAWEALGTSPENAIKTIPFVGALSEEGFATTMPDTSMEPFIQRHTILILDPKVNPYDRSYVLVKLHETSCYVFRQLLIDAEYRYLKPLNPDLSVFKMRLLTPEDEIVACLVEARYNCFVEHSQGAIQ